MLIVIWSLGGSRVSMSYVREGENASVGMGDDLGRWKRGLGWEGRRDIKREVEKF